jgi:group I intron endonuclease
MKITCIYKICNIISGRIYIGSAVDVKRRWHHHRGHLFKGTHHSRTMQRSWEKHGPDAFAFGIVELITDKANLIKREQYWIDFYDSSNPKTGFNIAPKAGSSLGRKHPPDILVKMRQPRKNKPPPFTAEHCAAISASRIGNQWGKGIPKTAEHRQKIRERQTGRKMPWIAKSNHKRKGEKRPLRSVEHCANISFAKIGRKLGPRNKGVQL